MCSIESGSLTTYLYRTEVEKSTLLMKRWNAVRMRNSQFTLSDNYSGRQPLLDINNTVNEKKRLDIGLGYVTRKLERIQLVSLRPFTFVIRPVNNL